MPFSTIFHSHLTFSYKIVLCVMLVCNIKHRLKLDLILTNLTIQIRPPFMK